MANANLSSSNSSLASEPSPHICDEEVVVEEWLQMQRRERKTELCNLKEISSAATHRKNFEQILINQYQTTPQMLDRSEDTQTEASVRPEAVIIEVRGLFESRPVSRRLQSQNFRHQLENIVRSVVNSQGNSASIQSTLRHASSNQSVISNVSSEEGSAASSNLPVPRPRRHAVSQPSPLASTPPLQTAPQVGPLRITEAIENIRREEFIAEISELLHQQLVSSRLSSDFRETLERRVQQQLEFSQTDGRRVLDVLNQLPPSGIQRNDFSHLGIFANQVADVAGQFMEMDDSVSIISATAQAVPLSETSVGMARQITLLRRDITRIQETLNQQTALQLDLQRIIRQEVAAAMCHSTTANNSTTTMAGLLDRAVSHAGRCLICLDKSADTVLYRCGHLCLCYPCGIRLKEGASSSTHAVTCPVCRAPVQDMIRAYSSGVRSEEI